MTKDDIVWHEVFWDDKRCLEVIVKANFRLKNKLTEEETMELNKAVDKLETLIIKMKRKYEKKTL